MATSPVMTFLNGTTQIDFFSAQFANPHINDVPGFAIKVFWNLDSILVHNKRVFIVYQGTLTATPPITTLRVSCNVGDTQLLVPDNVVSNRTSFFHSYNYPSVTNQLF